MSEGIIWKPVEKPRKSDNIVIVGSGKSLKGFDFNKLKNKDLYVITINDSVNAVPFADAWFTLDPWGLHGPQLPPREFGGHLYAAVPDDYGRRDAKSNHHRRRIPPNILPRITFLHRLASHNKPNISSDSAYTLGLSEDPRCISTGNSGYGAFNLAYHMKPKNILLLGIDGGMGYFYTDAKSNRPLAHLPKLFNSTREQMVNAGIAVINGSKDSAINTFEKYNPSEALEKFING